MSNKLRVAIVGCGRISEMYREVFKKLKDSIDVAYAVDVKKERAINFASNFEGCRAVTDYKECFGNVDVMHIACPLND